MLLEQILTELKTKYKNLGLSDEYLKVVAKRVGKTVKEEGEISEAVSDLEDELKFQQKQDDLLRTLKAEVRKSQEANRKSQEANGEEREGTLSKSNEKPTTNSEKPTTNSEKPTTEEIPSWARGLIDSNRALAEKLETLEKAKIQQSNEQKLISKLKDLGVNENFYALQVEGKTFQNDEEIDAFANAIKERETSFLQAMSNEKLGNVSPPITGNGAKEGQVSADVQAFVKTFQKD